jgi:hypothetical protein
MPSSVHEIRPTGGFPGSSFKYTPLQHVRVLFTNFLQGLFAEAPVHNYRWSPDEEETEIFIRSDSPIHVETVAPRPVINTTIGTVQFYSLGMDDMYSYDADIDRKVKVVLVPGTMSVNCCSRSGIECHNLAWVVAEHVWLLRELLLKAGFFEVGRGIQIGPPSAPGSIVAGEGADEWYCSTVSIPFQFNRKSAFTKLGETIAKNVELRVHTELPLVDRGRGGPALAGHEYPVIVHNQFPPAFSPASDAHGQTPDPAGLRTQSLPLQPHPLNPAKLVTIETVRPFRPSAFRRGAVFP